jgi:hypothetical protein
MYGSVLKNSSAMRMDEGLAASWMNLINCNIE